jgi:hypothetical protein
VLGEKLAPLLVCLAQILFELPWGLNPDLGGEKLVTNCLNCGMAVKCTVTISVMVWIHSRQGVCLQDSNKEHWSLAHVCLSLLVAGIQC